DDDTALLGLTRNRPGQYRLIATGLPTEVFAAAVGLKNGDLLDLVDAAVRRFKATGAWAESRGEHLADAPPAKPPDRPVPASRAAVPGRDRVASVVVDVPEGPTAPAAPGSALRAIQDRGYVTVAVGEDNPGYSRRDPKTGEWSGLEIDLARTIAEQIFGDPAR